MGVLRVAPARRVLNRSRAHNGHNGAMIRLLTVLVSAALLLSGGLTSLQAGSLVTALPFSIILLLMAVALVKALSLDRAVLQEHDRIRRLNVVAEHVSGTFSRIHPSTEEVTELVDDRIDYRLTRSQGILGRHRQPKAEKEHRGGDGQPTT